MTDEMNTAPAGKTPWHIWLVGILSLLWNGFGAYDFIMTTTQGEKYWRASGMNHAMVAYYHAMPAWMYAPWTLGVWGAVIGSVLLLMRNRYAVWAFGLSLIGAVISLIYGQFINPPPIPDSMGPMKYMSYVIVLIAALLLWYAWTQKKKGVLR